MEFIRDWRECFDRIRQLLRGSDPLFLSRVGGSDTNAVAAYLADLESRGPSNQDELSKHLQIVKKYNGYYDKANNFSAYLSFLKEMLYCYKQSNNILFCNWQLLSMFFPDNINKVFYRREIDGRRGFERLVEEIDAGAPNKVAFPFTFVEKLTSHPLTLFNVLAETLPGKKVLVVSPFSESIQANYHNRFRLFKNYKYPDFELRLCNSPITYDGLPEHLYPHKDWFETVEALKRDIVLSDFDFALLSCGSYAMPLGIYTERVLKKQSVYVGGVLQLYFGIMGRRYNNVFFTDQINEESFIYPLESRKYIDHVSIKKTLLRKRLGHISNQEVFRKMNSIILSLAANARGGRSHHLVRRFGRVSADITFWAAAYYSVIQLVRGSIMSLILLKND